MSSNKPRISRQLGGICFDFCYGKAEVVSLETAEQLYVQLGRALGRTGRRALVKAFNKKTRSQSAVHSGSIGETFNPTPRLYREIRSLTQTVGRKRTDRTTWCGLCKAGSHKDCSKKRRNPLKGTPVPLLPCECPCKIKLLDPNL